MTINVCNNNNFNSNILPFNLYILQYSNSENSFHRKERYPDIVKRLASQSDTLPQNSVVLVRLRLEHLQWLVGASESHSEKMYRLASKTSMTLIGYLRPIRPTEQRISVLSTELMVLDNNKYVFKLSR